MRDSDLGDDLLVGAEAIAAFVYGDPRKKRRVFHFAANGELPIFRVGDLLHARKSVLREFIEQRERAAVTKTEGE
jgi:hypothetical protein